MKSVYQDKQANYSKKLSKLFKEIKRINGNRQMSFEELVECFEIGYEFIKRRPESRKKYIESQGINNSPVNSYVNLKESEVNNAVDNVEEKPEG